MDQAEQEDEWAVNCILCKMPMQAGSAIATVKAKGIQSFIKSSRLRSDSKVETVLDNRREIKVHMSCSKSYNSKVNLKYFHSVDFDFKNNCFYCGNSLNNVSRMYISRVTNVHLKKTLLQRYSHLGNTKAKQFLNRLLSVSCLVEAEAVYHKKCQTNPPFDKSSEKITNTQLKQDITQIIINHLSINPDEGQFSVNEILSDSKDINVWPNFRYIKHKLKELYGDELIIQISKEDIIISRMSLAKSLLADHFNKNRLDIVEKERSQKIDDSSNISPPSKRTKKN